MKKYTFGIANTQFTGSKEIYNEVDHKILNESASGIVVKVNAENIGQAMVQADRIISEIILSQFANYPNMRLYKFLLETREVEEVSS